jgi:hypothetical protein
MGMECGEREKGQDPSEAHLVLAWVGAGEAILNE